MLRNDNSVKKVTILTETTLLIRDVFTIFREIYESIRDHIVLARRLTIIEKQLNGTRGLMFENHKCLERLEKRLNTHKMSIESLINVLDHRHNVNLIDHKSMIEKISTHIAVLEDEIDARF